MSTRMSMLPKGISHQWPTPILYGSENEKASVELATYILSEYKDHNQISANVQGKNLFDDKKFDYFKYNVVIPAFNKFMQQEFGTRLKKPFKLRAWITGSGTNYAMPKHGHDGTHLSAVFYLLCDEHNSGQLTMIDPRFNASRGYKDEFKKWFEKVSITPKTGDYIIFPSFLYHGVETFYGNIRLAMPVDLVFYDDE